MTDKENERYAPVGGRSIPPAVAQRDLNVSRPTLNRYGRRWFLGRKNTAGTRMWSKADENTAEQKVEDRKYGQASRKLNRTNAALEKQLASIRAKTAREEANKKKAKDKEAAAIKRAQNTKRCKKAIAKYDKEKTIAAFERAEEACKPRLKKT